MASLKVERVTFGRLRHTQQSMAAHSPAHSKHRGPCSTRQRGRPQSAAPRLRPAPFGQHMHKATHFSAALLAISATSLRACSMASLRMLSSEVVAVEVVLHVLAWNPHSCHADRASAEAPRVARARARARRTAHGGASARRTRLRSVVLPL